MLVVPDTSGDPDRRRPFYPDAHVANRPIAHQVLDSLEAAGIEKVLVVCTDRLADHAKACLESRSSRSLELTFISQPAPLDVAGALERVAPAVGRSPCVVHLASGLLDRALRPLIDRLRPDSPDVALIARRIEGDRATLDPAGVWLFGPGALSLATSPRSRPASRLDPSLVAERVTANRGTFSVCQADVWHAYTGDPVQLLELNRIALDRLDTPGHNPSDHGNRIEGRVRIDGTATVTRSVIVGPTVIGPGATINEAYIGPYTSVGADVRIEGAEIERSIIYPNASVLHVSGRLVASVVGRHARVFHDFSLPRAIRLRVGEGTEVALC